MADVRIRSLPAAASVGDTDIFVIETASGQSKKATGAQIASGVGGSATVADDIAKSGPTAIDRVQGIRGRAISATAPLLGQQYVWNGTEHVPAGRVLHVSLFGGVADADLIGGGTDLADAIEDAIRSLDPIYKLQSAIIQLDATPAGTAYRMGRTPLISQPCIIQGHGSGLFGPGTTILCDPGVTGLRVSGSDDLVVSPAGAFGVVIRDLHIEALGQDVTSTTGDYDATSDVFKVTNVADVSSFSVGQLIAIEGMGQPCTLQYTYATVTAGSSTVTLSTDGDRVVLAAGDAGAGDGSPAGMTDAGWRITIPGAYPYPTRVVDSGGGATLTMESAAATDATLAAVRWRAPLVGMIVSMTADSITIDAYGASTGEESTDLIMTAAEGRAVTIHHWDCGIDVRNQVKIRNVSVGGPAVWQGFAGAGIALRGDHGNVPQSTGVNSSAVAECEIFHNRHALYTVGSDSNASTYTSVTSNRSWDWSFVDISTLGNTYIGSHTDGGAGIITHDAPACASIFIYPYTEAGTANSFNPSCHIIGNASTYTGGTVFAKGIVNALQIGIATFNGTETFLGQRDQWARFKQDGSAGSLSFARLDVASNTNEGKYFRFTHESANRHHPICFSDDDCPDFKAGSLWFPSGFMVGDDPAFNGLDTSEAVRIEACKADTAQSGGPMHRDPRLGAFDTGTVTTGVSGLYRKGDLFLDARLTDGAPFRVTIEDGHGALTWAPSTNYVQYNVVRPTVGNWNGSYYTKTSSGSQASGSVEPTWSSAPALGNTFTDAASIEWTNTGDAAYSQPIELDGFLTHGITTSETWAQTDRHFLCGSVEVTGALSADATLTLPAGRYKRWILNSTTGGFSLLVKCATGATVTIASGKRMFVQCDGTEMLEMVDAGGGGSSSGSSGQVQTSDGAGGFSAPSNVLAGSGFVSIGASPATTGALRLVAAATAPLINFAFSGTDYNIVKTQSGGITFGDNGWPVQINAYGLVLNSNSGDLLMFASGVLAQTLTSSFVKSAKPIIGDSGSSSPHGAHGMTVKAMSGSTAILSAAEYCNYEVKVTGTGTNVIQFPAVTDGAAYTKYVWNAGSGTLAVQDTNAVAAAATLAAGTGALFSFSTSAVKQKTAAFTVA